MCCSSCPSSSVACATFSRSLGNLSSLSLESERRVDTILSLSLSLVICSSRSCTCFVNSASRSRMRLVTVLPFRFFSSSIFSPLSPEGVAGVEGSSRDWDREVGRDCTLGRLRVFCCRFFTFASSSRVARPRSLFFFSRVPVPIVDVLGERPVRSRPGRTFSESFSIFVKIFSLAAAAPGRARRAASACQNVSLDFSGARAGRGPGTWYTCDTCPLSQHRHCRVTCHVSRVGTLSPATIPRWPHLAPAASWGTLVNLQQS